MYPIHRLVVPVLIVCVLGVGAARTSHAHHAAFGLDATLAAVPEQYREDVRRIPDKPHFLLGIERKTDEWDQYQMAKKLWQTKGLAFSLRAKGIMDKTRESYVPPGSTQLHEELMIAGKRVRVLYTHHHYDPASGMFVFWGALGEENLAVHAPLYERYKVVWALGQISDTEWRSIQSIFGWAQFEAVKAEIHKVVEDGIAKNVKDYAEDMQLRERVLVRHAEALGDPRYEDRLAELVEKGSDVSVQDVMRPPFVRPEDFLPDVLVIGPNRFAGGFANFKTVGTERLVFLDLLGIAFNYIEGGYVIAAHEFVHTNPYLQGEPMAFYYDVEMWAALTTNLSGGMLEYDHPYLSVVTDSAKYAFGYDFREVKRRIWPSEFGAQEVREDEFRRYAAVHRRVVSELLAFIKDPENGLMVQFYSDPLGWSAVNTALCDTAAVWRLLFALRFEFAGIFDEDKKDKNGQVIPAAQQTKEWLSRERDAGRIRRLAKKAMEKTGKETEQGKDISKAFDLGGFMKCPVHSRLFFMAPDEQREFISRVQSLAVRAEDGDAAAIFELRRLFAGSGVLAHIRSVR